MRLLSLNLQALPAIRVKMAVTDTKLRAWSQNWNELGPILAAIKRRELEAMTDADARAHVAALFGGSFSMESSQRSESGLVEQQRWFAKAHRRP